MAQQRILALGVKRSLTSSLNGIATIGTFQRTRCSNSDGRRRLQTGPDETVEGIPRPVRDVLVVGGGVAGLATAACLGRVGLRVTIAADVSISDENDTKQKRSGTGFDPGIGIWTHGLDCLEKLGVRRRLESEGRYMMQAGYRDTVGNWLAKPSRPLEEFDKTFGVLPSEQGGTDYRARASGSGASVLFVRESKLMNVLRSTLPESTEVIDATVDQLQWEEGRNGRVGVVGCLRPRRPPFDTSGPPEDIAVGSSEPGRKWVGTFDLIVGADGADSFVRRETLGCGGREKNSVTMPERRGYVVYRGVCSLSAATEEAPEHGFAARASGGGGGDEVQLGGRRSREHWGLESFQTWGPGLRFASVPLARDERMWFATVADGGLVNDEINECGSPVYTPPAARIKPFLMETFGAWHEPISSLLRATRDEDIAWEDARAMTAQGLRVVASSRNTAASAGQSEKGQPWRSGVVLVGDAAHMLDPVLAQGAGVALEDAFILARRLRDYNDSQERLCLPGASRARSGMRRGGLEAVLARYDEERLRRVLLLSGLSDLSQSLGHLRPSGIAQLRNSLASFVPSVARSLVFDCFMATSLAGGSAGAVRAAMAAIGRGGGDARFGGYRMPDL